MAVTVVLTPMLQKAEKCRLYQEIGGCYIGNIILQNPVSIRSIPFKCIFVRLEKPLMRENINAKFHWHYISVWSLVLLAQWAKHWLVSFPLKQKRFYSP